GTVPAAMRRFYRSAGRAGRNAHRAPVPGRAPWPASDRIDPPRPPPRGCLTRTRAHAPAPLPPARPGRVPVAHGRGTAPALAPGPAFHAVFVDIPLGGSPRMAYIRVADTVGHPNIQS